MKLFLITIIKNKNNMDDQFKSYQEYWEYRFEEYLLQVIYILYILKKQDYEYFPFCIFANIFYIFRNKNKKN